MSEYKMMLQDAYAMLRAYAFVVHLGRDRYAHTDESINELADKLKVLAAAPQDCAVDGVYVSGYCGTCGSPCDVDGASIALSTRPDGLTEDEREALEWCDTHVVQMLKDEGLYTTAEHLSTIAAALRRYAPQAPTPKENDSDR